MRHTVTITLPRVQASFIVWAASQYAENILPTISKEVDTLDLAIDGDVRDTIVANIQQQITLVREGSRSMALQIAQDTLNEVTGK